jgi:hypothetical protein
VDMPEQAASRDTADAPVVGVGGAPLAGPPPTMMEEESQDSESSPELPRAFETHLPFKPATPLPKAAAAQSDQAARKTATRPAAATNKRVAADGVERHRDGRRRRSLVEKVQRAYHQNKILVVVVSVLLLMVFFIVMILTNVGTLFDVYRTGHNDQAEQGRIPQRK